MTHEGEEVTSRPDNYNVSGTESSTRLYACPNIASKVSIVHADRNTPGFMRSPPETPYLFALESAMDELRVLALVHQSPTLMSALDEIKAAGGDVATKNALGENLELQDAAHTEYLEGAGPPFISIGPSSRTDPEDVALWIVQTLSHEVGHALYSAPDKSSKILYVQSQLDSEGAATVSNIIIGNEFKANGIDIGVAGNQNNKPYYEQQFGLLADGSQSYAETIRNIGVRYGASEKSSAPGNPIYRVFYENQYDTKIAPHLPH